MNQLTDHTITKLKAALAALEAMHSLDAADHQRFKDDPDVSLEVRMCRTSIADLQSVIAEMEAPSKQPTALGHKETQMKLPEPAYRRLSDLQSGLNEYYTENQMRQMRQIRIDMLEGKSK